MDIRLATADDLDAILDVHNQAFGQGAEAGLVDELLRDPSAQPSYSLIALKDDRCVGHVLFTAATLVNAQSPTSASILAPLAVQPNHQSQGYGGGLIEAGLEVLRADGVDLVFVLGETKLRRFFQPTLAHINAGEWEDVAQHLEHTQWYKDVTRRGPRVVGYIRKGDA